MNDNLLNTKKSHSIQITDLFKDLGNDSFYISNDCVFVESRTIVKSQVYLVVEFHNISEIKNYPIKFLHAYRKGFHVFIFGMDLTTDEFIYKKLRLDSKTVTCDWLIVDIDFFDDNELNENAKKFINKKILYHKQFMR